MTSYETACRPDLLANVFIVNVNSASERGANNSNGTKRGSKVGYGQLRDWFIGRHEQEKVQCKRNFNVVVDIASISTCTWHTATTSAETGEAMQVTPQHNIT